MYFEITRKTSRKSKSSGSPQDHEMLFRLEIIGRKSVSKKEHVKTVSRNVKINPSKSFEYVRRKNIRNTIVLLSIKMAP